MSLKPTQLLYNGECNEEMEKIPDKSVDLIFADLPYAQTSCAWDVMIDHEAMWKHFMRIKKLNTPLFFTTTTKFGVELIKSAPKQCPFRYDIVWIKSAPCGFLSARKMPMRKHEMIYVFYEKLPFYDLSSHKHKFIKEVKPVSIVKETINDNYGCPRVFYTDKNGNKIKEGQSGKDQTKYDPPLPVSIVKEEEKKVFKTECETAYGKATHHSYRDTVYDPPLPVSIVKQTIIKDTKFGTNTYDTEKRNKPIMRQSSEAQYEPPLPVSIVKEELNDKNIKIELENTIYGDFTLNNQPTNKDGTRNKYRGELYNPPLPVSVVKEEPQHKWVKGATDIYGGAPTEDSKECGGHQKRYDPPLPVSVVKELHEYEGEELCKYDVNKNTYGGGKEGRIKVPKDKKFHEAKYDPPLPNSVVKEDVYKANERFKNGKLTKHARNLQKGDDPIYDPPLPVSVVKEVHEYEGEELCKYDVNKNTYGGGKEGRIKVPKDKKFHEAKYDPPLPNSVVKEDVYKANERFKNGKLTKHARNLQKGDDPIYDPPLPNSVVKETYEGNKEKEELCYGIQGDHIKERKNGESRYDPPLPNSMLEIKSTRGKHSTEKPVQLMEWILKYYSKEGDTVLDPTMGSGSTGVACKNMNRNFIGIEKDPEIYEGAVNRIED